MKTGSKGGQVGSGLEGALVITVAGDELEALREILGWARLVADDLDHGDMVAKIDLFEEAFDGAG